MYLLILDRDLEVLNFHWRQWRSRRGRLPAYDTNCLHKTRNKKSDLYILFSKGTKVESRCFMKTDPQNKAQKYQKYFRLTGGQFQKAQKAQKSKIIPFLNRYFLTKWQVGARGTDALGYTVCYRCPVQPGKSQVQLL